MNTQFTPPLGFIPIEWFWPTAASGPIPCKWIGLIDGQVVIVTLMTV